MSPRAKANFRRNLALLVGSLALALALCEVFTRIYLGARQEHTVAPLIAQRERLLGKVGGTPGSAVVEQHGRYEDQLDLHPFFGFMYRKEPLLFSFNAHAPKHANRWGFQSDYDIGLCGDRYCVDNEPDRRKMLVIGFFGGSFAHFVADFGDYLEDALEKDFPGRKVIVLNFAMGGHAFPQALNLYTYFRDVVDVPVFLDGLNEIWNSVENNRVGFPPEFAKAAHYKVLTESAAVRSDERLKAETRIRTLKSRIRGATELSLLTGFRDSALVFLAWSALTSSWSNQIQGEVARIEKSFNRGGPFFDVPSSQILDFAARQWGEYHRLLARIAKLQGVPSIHLLQPNPFVPGSRELSSTEQELVNKSFKISWVVKNGYPRLREEMSRFREPGALSEDLTDYFKTVREDVWIDSSHTNARGSYLIMDRVAALVRKAIHK